MAKENGGLFGKIISAAHGAGEIWREKIKPGLDRINERARDAGDMASSAKSYFQQNFTEDGKALKDQWTTILSKGASHAISGIRGIAAVSWESLSGLHPKLGLALLELHRLESLASAKTATEIQELVAAKEYFDIMRRELELNAELDLGAEFATLQTLLEKAKQAIIRVPANANEARRLYITVAGTVGELAQLSAEYASRSADYVAKFGPHAIATPIDSLESGNLKILLQSANQQLKSDQPMTAAIPLSNLARPVDELREAYIKAIELFGRELQELTSLDGLMSQMLSNVEGTSFKDDPTLLAAARAFIKATRTTPIDLAAARRHKDEYIDRYEELAF